MTTSIQPTHDEDQPSNRNPGRLSRGFILPELATSLDPFPWYRTMRESEPIHYDARNNLWHIFRYNDVQRVLTDPTNFSSEVAQSTMTEEEKKQSNFEPSILNLDPPRHRQLRSLVTQAFTPRTVARLAPRITEIVNEHLDRVANTGKIDIIADLAYPLPVIVIAELLGVPPHDRDRFKHWSDAVVSPNTQESRQAIREMRGYLKEITDQHRIDPKEDLITALLSAQINGKHLTERELMSFYVLLLVAGNETTTNLIGNALVSFDEYPETIDRLRGNPSLIPTAVEEALRFRSPVQRMIRVATADVTIGGQTIKAGQMVTPWIGSANRDENQFPDPDSFEITRTPNRHLAFGHGIHFCVGAPLSRIEAKIAFEVLFQRFSTIRRDRSVPLRRIPAASAFFGVQELPMTFELA
ncbi:MAG TPA: cytochrome P450 [Ktedonobacteraceae bacterium]|nr:cytochrome P450 [Ktedonobacteraceae bacterium]